jgi:WD40 repeat protein/serine/threonine protein kinase/tetratricopeptide (TPR) repeat protein
MQEQSIFIEALEKEDAAERKAFLDQACAGDPELRQRLERLLQRHHGAGSFLESPAVNLAPTADNPITERPGTVVGPYKLLEQIGEGGFGVVFMAEQTEPIRRKVALKVLKPGVDTRQVIARFGAERQALALMDHPNIAHILDGGETASGRPYFVMELVRGVPITEFCDENHLPVRERLELFISVCQAVQHAHQKGIIHRDIKPPNVLVMSHDGKPVVKVIDFGVAKAIGQRLSDKTICTQFAQLIGTPLYMSPEQAGEGGLDIDTRTDIYALGVLLYELLTGTTPFDRERLQEAGYEEIRRVIREEEPPKPSTRISTLGQAATTASTNRESDPKQLSRLFRGELDWIVMKCLEKDRNRRYETANGLGHDIQRYLNDEAVQACPPSAMYRFRKFGRRNRRALATAVVVSAALLLTVVVLAVSNFRITREQEVKDEALQQARINAESANTQRSIAQVNANEADKQRQIAVKQERLAKEQELTARRRLYASQTNLAYEAWKKGQTARVIELLESLRPQSDEGDLRSFEWYFLWNLGRRGAQKVLRGHSGQVQSVAFAPDGKTLAAGDVDGGVRLWDVATGKERLALPRQGGNMWGLAYSPDGRTLATGSHIADIVRLWDPGNGKEKGNLPCKDVLSLAFGPDGTTLAAGSNDGTVRLWNMRTRREPAMLRGMPAAYVNLALSPDGKRLAAANAWSETPRTLVWDLTTEPPRVSYRLPGAVVVAFSPDSQTLALAGDGKLSLVDAATGKEKLKRQRDTGYIKAIAFSPDGRSLAYGGDDRTVRLWNPLTDQERCYSHDAPVNCLAFSPDGLLVASGGKDQTVKFWDVSWEPDAVSLQHGDAVKVLAFSPDGRRLATGSADTLRVWNLIDSREVARLKLSTGKVRHALVFSHDGKTLAVAGGHTIKLFDTDRWQERATLDGHASDIWNLAFSPDDRTLASGIFWETEDPFQVKVWDVSTGRARFTVPGNAVAFSPDGRLLATGLGHVGRPPASVMLTDVASGRERITLSSGVPALAHAVVFSPDGNTVAQVTNFGQIYLWDVRTGALRNSLKGHTAYTWSVAFHPDGKILASTNRDGSITMWDLVTGQERMVLTGHAHGANFVAFSPDGKTLASAGEDGLVKLWYGPAGQDARAPNAELDPLVVHPPPTGDVNQWTEQLRLHKVLEEDPDTARVTRPQLAQKYFDLAELFTSARRFPEATEAYTKTIELYPGSARAWRNRGTAYACVGQWEKARCDFSRAIELEPNFPPAWTSRAAAYAASSQWNRAATEYSKLLERNPDDMRLQYAYALTCLGAADPARYRRACTTMLERFGGTYNPEVAYWLAWSAVVGPDGVKDWDRLIKLAEAAARHDPGSYTTALGAALYRAHRLPEAVQRLNEDSADLAKQGTQPLPSSSAYTWFFLAMSHQQLDRCEDARQWLDKASEQMDRETTDPNVAWDRRLTLQLLRREAETLLGTKKEERSKNEHPKDAKQKP